MATNLQPAFNGSVGTYAHDNLIAGTAVNMVTESIVLDTGNLVRGSVLGKITATGKYVLSASAAVDGSQTPVAILAEDADATAADKTTIAYLTGEFNTAALTLGAGHTLDSIKAGLRDQGIFLKTNLSA
jgi:hypothetical protein